MRRETKPQSGGLGLFVVGAVVGAAAAILLAPESGTDSRKRIGHWLHDHRGTGHELFTKVKKMWEAKHNGIHEANGRISDRRHGGAA